MVPGVVWTKKNSLACYGFVHSTHNSAEGIPLLLFTAKIWGGGSLSLGPVYVADGQDQVKLFCCVICGFRVGVPKGVKGMAHDARNYHYLRLAFYIRGQKQVYPVRLGPKTGTFWNQVKNAPHEPCHWSKSHSNCFCRVKPRRTRVCLICLTFNCFLSFFSQPEMFHSSTLCPLYECRRPVRPPQQLVSDFFC